jgi:trehalose 2-sulfotransferase
VQHSDAVVRPGSSYLVAATQRSGSTMLCRALTDTGVAGRPEEYFLCGPGEEFPKGPRFWEQGYFQNGQGLRGREAYLERVFRAGTTPNGVFGAKLMWSHVPCTVEKLSELPRFRGLGRAAVLRALLPDLRVIRLVRRDRVRQAVSWARAAQDGVWVTEDAAPPTPVAEPAYDEELIAALEGLLVEGEREWPRLCDELGVAPLTLYYEDLVDPDRYEGVVRAALAHLGVHRADLPVPPPRTSRQADALNDEWVRRYEADRGGSCGLGPEGP